MKGFNFSSKKKKKETWFKSPDGKHTLGQHVSFSYKEQVNTGEKKKYDIPGGIPRPEPLRNTDKKIISNAEMTRLRRKKSLDRRKHPCGNCRENYVAMRRIGGEKKTRTSRTKKTRLLSISAFIIWSFQRRTVDFIQLYSVPFFLTKH